MTISSTQQPVRVAAASARADPGPDRPPVAVHVPVAKESRLHSPPTRCRSRAHTTNRTPAPIALKLMFDESAHSTAAEKAPVRMTLTSLFRAESAVALVMLTEERLSVTAASLTNIEFPVVVPKKVISVASLMSSPPHTMVEELIVRLPAKCHSSALPEAFAARSNGPVKSRNDSTGRSISMETAFQTNKNRSLNLA
jgi:hypothetical protein